MLQKICALNNKLLQSIVSKKMSHGAANETVFEQNVNIRSYSLRLPTYKFPVERMISQVNLKTTGDLNRAYSISLKIISLKKTVIQLKGYFQERYNSVTSSFRQGLWGQSRREVTLSSICQLNPIKANTLTPENISKLWCPDVQKTFGENTPTYIKVLA